MIFCYSFVFSYVESLFIACVGAVLCVFPSYCFNKSYSYWFYFISTAYNWFIPSLCWYCIVIISLFIAYIFAIYSAYNSSCYLTFLYYISNSYIFLFIYAISIKCAPSIALFCLSFSSSAYLLNLVYYSLTE